MVNNMKRRKQKANTSKPASSPPLNAPAQALSGDETKRRIKIKIHRIVGATDPGHAVNPAQIDRQVAGSFVYGLSALFYGECTVKDGRIEQANFDTYNSMRIAEMPKVESIIMPSGGFWGGVGEPTIFVAAPAVLNAFFVATGKRIRSFPLKNHNISFA